jgi:hypothetical protein
MHINIPLFKPDTFSIDGVTLCFLIVTWIRNPSAKLLRHEQEHVKQWKASPFLFHFRYFSDMLRGVLLGMSWREAYLAIPYEVEARKASEKDTP